MFNENPFKHITSHQENSKAEIEKDPIIKELQERILELSEHRENSIGKGITAEVFISKTNPDVCYKIICGDGEYGVRNNVDIEGELLAKAEKISKSTEVKIPKPYYSILTKNGSGDEFEVLVMERLHALSIRDIINGNLDVPENFDFKKFASAVDVFFEKMHNQNVYHRDAHWGNIMIENETSVPCVIDFGTAIETPLSSEDPYKQTNSLGKTIPFIPDEQRVRQEIRIELRRYLHGKYGNIHNL